MCGGFNCSKNALIALNVLFLMVSFILIGVASYAKAVAMIGSFEIAGGIIACGLFLLIISILGLIAASKHHQVLLFFFFVVLFLLFILQFSISIACLAVTDDFQRSLLHDAWFSKENSTVMEQTVYDAEVNFKCCGWDEEDMQNSMNICLGLQGNKQAICTNETSTATVSMLPTCTPCEPILMDKVGAVLVATGGIGLFFSFTEMLGVYLAIRFRNQKDPRANPSQFL